MFLFWCSMWSSMEEPVLAEALSEQAQIGDLAHAITYYCTSCGDYDQIGSSCCSRHFKATSMNVMKFNVTF